MTEISLLNLGAPAKILVEKIANAFGRHFDPRQTVRMADAEAKAHHILELNKAETDLEVADLRRRAAARIINEEMTKQENIENITAKAIQQLNDDARPGEVGDDWITNFFDKCRIVSDEQMQEIWAHILAGEANNPGSFSRRTVNLMADLDRRDAELFRNLCGFVWTSGSHSFPFVFDVEHNLYNQQGIDFNSLGHLESLALIRFDNLTGFMIPDLSEQFLVTYHGNNVLPALPKSTTKKEFNLGKVLFTRPGAELYRICQPTPIAGFFEYVYDKWASESLVPPRAT